MDQSKSHSELSELSGSLSELSALEATYQAPTIEVIALDCEISAYAPDDGDVPLF